MLRGEINYTKAPLGEVFGHMARKFKTPYQEWMYEIKKQLTQRRETSFAIVWSNTINQYLKGSYLNKKDIEELKALGNQMGCLDAVMQLSALDLYLEQLERELFEVRKELEIKKRLSNCLGVMGGIFITIVLL